MEPLIGGSRPSDKGRGAVSQKIFFWLLGPHFDQKIRGATAPPLHPPLPLPRVFDMLQYFEAILPSLKSL